MQPPLIPALDPNPLPAPFWVFKALLLITFFLHILAMNLLLGGALLAVALRRQRANPAVGRILSDLTGKLPVLMASTITIGVAPLLFMQVLYGQFFYTSSVLIAWPWFLVIVLLLVAYYGLYSVSTASGDAAANAGKILLLSVVALLGIGFIYVTNMTLSQTPEVWRAKYFANPSGWHLNLAERTLAPRAIHFVAAAIAVGGLLLMTLALRRWSTDKPYARQAYSAGVQAFVYATAAQFGIGFWFLIALPAGQRMIFMGGDAVATGSLLVGMAVALAVVMAVLASVQTEDPRRPVFMASLGTAIVIAAMLVARDRLRDAYLRPYFGTQHFAVETQWSTLPLFLALFLGGTALWFVMLKRFGLIGRSPAARTVAASVPRE